MEFDDEPVFKLAPSRVDFITANTKAQQTDQRTLLNKDNILRARQLTNTNYSTGEAQSAEHAVRSAARRNTATANEAEDSRAKMNQNYPVRTHRLGLGINVEEYQNAFGANPVDKLTANKFIQGTKNRNVASTHNKSAVSFEEKAANAADYHLVQSILKVSLDYKTNNHLDGPVLSNVTAGEENAGQMTHCIDASSGFECDGNRFTSVTKNSTE